MERGRSQGLPKFFEYSLLSQEWVKLRTSNVAATFTGSVQTKAHEKLGEKGAWANSGSAHFWVPPIISGTGKATNFRFGCGIDRVHPNKSPLKILVKRSVGVSRDCRNFFSTPYYLRTVKLRTSNFVRTFLILIGTKARYKFREK